MIRKSRGDIKLKRAGDGGNPAFEVLERSLGALI